MRVMPTDMGGRMRYLRERAGLSQEHVALEIGLSARVIVIGDWERNYRTPRLVYLRQLAPLYRVPIATLVDAETIAEEVAAGVT